MKRILIVALVIAGLAGAGWWAYGGRSSKNGKGAMRQVQATQGPIEETVEATGAVAPLNRVEIKPPISGRMEQLLADEGAVVKKGQILAWMSSSDRAAILDAARAQGPDALKHWEDAYKPTPVVAPLDGVIILRNVVVGQTVETNLVLFAMSDRLVVVGQVDESDVGRIHVGMPARVTLDSYPDKQEKATVFDILYEGKNVSNGIQYGVKLRPEAVPPYYRSQMTANISFIVRKKEDAVLIPSVAVKDTPSGAKQVMVPGADGKPAPTDIKTGIETGDMVEVVSGLKAGDAVLLTGDKYVPQKGPESSPLMMTGPRRQGNQGQAPKPKKT